MDSISSDVAIEIDTPSVNGYDYGTEYRIFPPSRRMEQKIIDIFNQACPSVLNTHKHIRLFLQKEQEKWCPELPYITISDSFLEKI